jgi:2-polyprenyl-6-methoxyphenol hydroxylase-like FAD-dependent oxidoreductase
MYDAVVVGAGFAGSLCAILLTRQGYRIRLLDRHAVQPSEFRTEQIVGDQVDDLRRLGVLDALTDGQAPVETAVGYRGRTQIRTERAPHYGLPYALMVRRLRALVPEAVFGQGEVVDVRSEPDRIRVLLRDQEIECRFVILATGLNRRLADRLSLRRLVLSKQHSFVLGMYLEMPADAKDILVQYGTPDTGIDYLTIFPFQGGWRGNLFGYGDGRQLRRVVMERGLSGLMPVIDHNFGPVRTMGRIEMRANDLLMVSGPLYPRIALVGDAYQTPCPALGNGISRLLSDVTLLCEEHLPRWFAASDFSADSVRRFYDDPRKRAADRRAIKDAFFRRQMTCSESLRWRLQRWRIYGRLRLTSG